MSRETILKKRLESIRLQAGRLAEMTTSALELLDGPPANLKVPLGLAVTAEAHMALEKKAREAGHLPGSLALYLEQVLEGLSHE